MKNNDLPQKSQVKNTIFTSIINVYNRIKSKISILIEFQIIKWLGPYLHYAIDRILSEKEQNKFIPKYEIDSSDYDSMKYVVKNYFKLQNKLHTNLGAEKELMRHIDRMSFDEIKDNFEVINDSINHCRKKTFELPSKECEQESKMIQLSIDKKENENK